MPRDGLMPSCIVERILCVAGALLVLAAAPMGTAQTIKAEPATTATAPTKTTGQPGPAWAALTPLQRQALSPLSTTWDSLSTGQQRKWLEVSRNYPALTVVDQVKMHGRMTEWVALSARERSAARLNFAATTEIAKELSPQEKKAKWDAYQALSLDERKKLADRGNRPPVGAAPATRPVATQKLAIVPNSAAAPVTARPPKMEADPRLETKPVQSAPGAAAEAASTAGASVDRAER